MTKTFSHLLALNDISLELSKGEILGLIGPNGSGKTTLINVVSGIFKPDGGNIRMEETDITGLRSHKVVYMGLNRTFQTPRPFFSLTVEENVRLAYIYSRRHTGSNESDQIDWALSILGLEKLRGVVSFSLNTFNKKLLDLARAIVTSPKILLVDELAAGLNQSEIEVVKKLLLSLRDKGISLMVVEHVMSFIKDLSDRVIVMDAGNKIFEGKFGDAAKDEKVREVYLGRRSVA